MRYRTLQLVLTCLFMATIVTVSGMTSTEHIASASATSEPKSLSKQFATWSYRAAKTTDDVESAITTDFSSVQKLKDFVNTNKDLAKELKVKGIQNFEAQLTFKKPLSVESFSKIVEANNIKVNSFLVRVATPEGERITIVGVPDPDSLVPTDKLNRQLSYVLERRPKAILQGIVEAEIQLSNKDYDSLLNLPEVFLIDVTKTSAKQDLVQYFSKDPIKHFYLESVHPYWFMEDLGLDNFK